MWKLFIVVAGISFVFNSFVLPPLCRSYLPGVWRGAVLGGSVLGSYPVSRGGQEGDLNRYGRKVRKATHSRVLSGQEKGD